MFFKVLILFCVLSATLAHVQLHCNFSNHLYEGAFTWLLQQRNTHYGWEKNTERVVLALQMTDPHWLKEMPSQMTVKQMNAEIAEQLMKSMGTKTTRYADLPAGVLAYTINAIVFTCQNPRDFLGNNLVQALRLKMNNTFPTRGFNNHFQYSLCVLAMCNSASKIYQTDIETLLQGQMNDGSYRFGLDEASMDLMAITCLKSKGYSLPSVRNRVRHILSHQLPDGSFGNAHTTALALQALSPVGAQWTEFYWDCMKALQALKNMQFSNGSFGSLFTTVHVLPALRGESYIFDQTRCPSPPVTVEENQVQSFFMFWDSKPYITVRISVQDDVRNWFHFSEEHYFESGTSLYDILETLAGNNDKYSFRVEVTSWGRLLTMLSHIENDWVSHRYWTIDIAKPGQPAQALATGIDSVIPEDGDHFIFRYVEIDGGHFDFKLQQ